MDRRLILSSICALILMLAIHSAYAIPEPAPGPNTMETFCSSGTCITPSIPVIKTEANTTDVGNAVNFNNETGASVYGIPLSHSQLIGIQLSKACIKMEQNNITSHCLTYDKLKFLDNTNPSWSGQWVNDTWYHRALPHISNSYISNPNPFVVLVDPDPSYSARAKMIIIQSDSFIWINPDENASNTQLIQHVDRFVLAPCEGATVAPNIAIIADTVKYIESGCTKTSFNDAKIIKRNATGFDFIHCKQCIYDSWKNQAKLITKNCINVVCSVPHDPFQNTAYYAMVSDPKKIRN